MLTKERPILFRDWEVRATMDGRKGVFRRTITYVNRIGEVMEFQRSDTKGYDWIMRDREMRWNDLRHADIISRSRYGVPGDRLWVREAWCQKLDDDARFVYNAEGNLDSSCCWYRADGIHVYKGDGDGGIQYTKSGLEASAWSPSVHMPRWASRLTLEIVSVGVERLQDITEEDARKEGVDWVGDGGSPYGIMGIPASWGKTAKHAFAVLWDPPYAWPGFGWDVNPWVWRVEFKRVAQEDK
jgi:hypothetical protein